MISLLKRALSDREILRAAICSAPVPIAIYNDDDKLIAWSPGYEQLHTQAFSDRRACAEAGNLTYRDIMRYQIDSRLGTDDAEAELDRLVSISPSAMKIDQRIVLPGPSSEKIQKLIQAIVDIGSALDIPIIAEGVETDEHVRMVRDLGCDYMQGYALAKPMSREELLHLFGPEQHSRLAA